MGNTVPALQGRSEDENVEVFKRVVGKYEEIRSRSQLSFLSGGSPSQVNSARLSELQVYKELEQELFRVLGNSPPSSSRLSDNSNNSSSASGLVVGGGRHTTGKETGSTPRVGFSLERQSSEANPSTSGNAASIPKSQGVGTDVATPTAGLVLGEGRKRASILVVDDSPISCKLAKRGLGHYNFRVEIALDGRRGLDILYSRPLDFDLVLLDIVMPGLDGIEVLRCMKNHPLLRSIAVVMLSGLQDEMLEEVCIQHGAVAVLKKPIKVDNVLRVVPIDCQRGTPSSSASLSSQPQGTSPSSPPHIPTKQTKAVGEKSGGEAIPEPGGVPKTSPEPTPWKFTGKAMPGQEAPSFNLLDSRKKLFRLDEFLARSPDRKLLLVFFPAAFTEAFSDEESEETGSVRFASLTPSGEESPTGAGTGTESVLSVLMANIAAIKATDTAVVGICKDLPYTLSALCAEKGLDFPVLSDPFLAVSEQFVGTFDLGMFFPSAFGFRSPSPTSHRGAHTGIVVLDGRRKCLYRWLSVDENGNPVLPAVVDLPELMISLEATGFWADNPTNQSAGLGAEASRQIGVIPKISSFISDKGVKSSGGSEERRYRSESGTLTGLENTSRKVVILIVDDSTISFKLATRKLRALGYATLLAENGKAALETLRRRRNQVDLVLLDIVMPVMDGVEFLNIVKNDPDLQHTPVVIVSSVDREQLGRACMEAGALAVLHKPFKAHEVQDLIVREGIA